MPTFYFKAKVLADSIPLNGQNRITTLELIYPRMIHAELLTHRTHSRNSASSRAIPVGKMIDNIRNHPFVPLHWGKNQSGMQAYKELSPDAKEQCKNIWLGQLYSNISACEDLLDIGLHKQIANRLLEPWMWITVIATANYKGWENLFKLRCHHAAEPHFQKIAGMARDAIEASTPKELRVGGWHLPLVDPDGPDRDLSPNERLKVCVGRCARVSYLTHDGHRDPQADIDLHDSLKQNGHWSPFEHAARNIMLPKDKKSGNLGQPWLQYRKTFIQEFV